MLGMSLAAEFYGPHMPSLLLVRQRGTRCREIYAVSNFVESSFKSSFELLEFLLHEFFCDSTILAILAGISTR